MEDDSVTTAFDLVQQVRKLGGTISVQDKELEIEAPVELPKELIAGIKEQKTAVMIALGAPFDVAVASVLAELRPHLPPAVRKLSDAQLLVMVNWSIMSAWGRAVQQIGRAGTSRTSNGDHTCHEGRLRLLPDLQEELRPNGVADRHAASGRCYTGKTAVHHPAPQDLQRNSLCSMAEGGRRLRV